MVFFLIFVGRFFIFIKYCLYYPVPFSSSLFHSIVLLNTDSNSSCLIKTGILQMYGVFSFFEMLWKMFSFFS